MQNYNYVQKLLHDFVLKSKLINKSLFELEKMIYLKKINISNYSHIFITGLPRSGTTILLNYIYSSKMFASLKYLNMPFVFSPNISKIFVNNKNIKKKQRLHNDGIDYDLYSPEAFDEIFLSLDNEFIKNELCNYIKLILLSENKQRYLSKNNGNYKRISLISSIIPNSIFLIPIRDPLQHAYSLLNQHLHFSKLQEEDDFIKRYMGYLGHYEFGLNHKSWNKPVNFFDKKNINYWLEQWLLFYLNILNKYRNAENCFFILYENLSTFKTVKNLANKINIDENIPTHTVFKNLNKKQIFVEYDSKIYNEAYKIYNNYKNTSI